MSFVCEFHFLRASSMNYIAGLHLQASSTGFICKLRSSASHLLPDLAESSISMNAPSSSPAAVFKAFRKRIRAPDCEHRQRSWKESQLKLCKPHRLVNRLLLRPVFAEQRTRCLHSLHSLGLPCILEREFREFLSLYLLSSFSPSLLSSFCRVSTRNFLAEFLFQLFTQLLAQL